MVTHFLGCRDSRAKIDDGGMVEWKAQHGGWASFLGPTVPTWLPEQEGEMTDFAALSIRVKGKDLVVTLPGSNYAVTYFKRDGSPGLFAKDIVQKDDPRLPQTSAEFLSKARKLANQKARELGWIA